MRNRLRAFSGFLILMLMAAVAAVPAIAGEEGHFDRTLTVTGPVDLTVQTGSGDITVRPGDSGKVEIHAKIHANGMWNGSSATERIHAIETNPPIEQTGNTIRVGHFENREMSKNISISYEVIVPAETKLRSESGSGDEKIEGIKGPVDATSGSGELRLAKIGGEAHVRTGSGDVELNSIAGSVHASTGSGGIHATGVAGGLNASSGSGNVTLEQTSAGDVEISTGSGNIELKGVKGGARASTGSGSIHAQGEPTGEWRLHTGSGDITAELPSQAAFDLHARTSSGSIESKHEIMVVGKVSPRELQGKVRGGGVLVELSTSSGSIEIR